MAMKRKGVQFYKGIGDVEIAFVNRHKIIYGKWMILTERVDEGNMPIAGTRVYHKTLDKAIDFANND